MWVSINETTDSCRKKVANFIVGEVNKNQSTECYLLTSEIMLFVSDVAPYVVKARRELKKLFPKLMHIACVVYGLHLVSKVIRLYYIYHSR